MIWLNALAVLMLAFAVLWLAGHEKTGDTPKSVLQAVIRANSEKDLGTLAKHMAKDPDLVVYSVGWPEICRLERSRPGDAGGI